MPASSKSILVLGGARSGKSAYAEALSEADFGARVYIATAEAGDGEMAERIAAHRARRGAGWTTVEEPVALAQAIDGNARDGGFVLVDCITLWLSNLMHGEHDIERAVSDLCESLSRAPGTVVVVSNEVGLGIVPDNALARRFRDEAGRAHQALGACVDEVVFVAAGLPLFLKRAEDGR